MSSGKALDENEMVAMITDGPIVSENITIDQHYKFLQIIKAKDKEIARLRAALEFSKEKLQIFRRQTGDSYEGGMEYMMLMNLIEKALAGGEDE